MESAVISQSPNPQLLLLQESIPSNFTTNNITRLEQLFVQYKKISNHEFDQEFEAWEYCMALARTSRSWKTARFHFHQAVSQMEKWCGGPTAIDKH